MPKRVAVFFYASFKHPKAKAQAGLARGTAPATELRGLACDYTSRLQSYAR